METITGTICGAVIIVVAIFLIASCETKSRVACAEVKKEVLKTDNPVLMLRVCDGITDSSHY